MRLVEIDTFITVRRIICKRHYAHMNTVEFQRYVARLNKHGEPFVQYVVKDGEYEGH